MSDNQHILKSYDAELARLTGEIVRMGELARAQLAAAIEVVERRDDRAARHVVANDDAIDQLEHAINDDVMRLLALRAPMAGDLRAVFAALRIASDIERIGDYASNIARRTTPLLLTPPLPAAGELRHLATLADAALHAALAAWQAGDAAAALAVWHSDVTLDEAYTSLFRGVLTCMLEDPRRITPGLHLLFMAKNIERIGDHVTNIAENVWFVATGTPLDAPRQSHDTTTEPDYPPLGTR